MLPETSTVFEHLLLHATLRLRHIPALRRAAAIDDTLRALGMAHKAHCAIGGELVRGLSGGERRRVSVGVELLMLRAGGGGGTPPQLLPEPISTSPPNPNPTQLILA